MTARIRPWLFREDWAVGLVRRPIESFLEDQGTADTLWLSQPDARSFLADPFGFRDGDRLTILAERFDRQARKGVIDALTVESGAVSAAPKTVLEKRHHLSYPYVFEDQGQTYCIPESSYGNVVPLYRIDRSTGRLEYISDLLSGVKVSDATLFRHEGLYWLAGICNGPRLHLWHAREIAGPWSAHAGNPVKIDPGSARPAGTPFVHDGDLYRPAQDGSSVYGGAVVVNRIVKLDPAVFHEEGVARISPDPEGPFPDGLHTLSAVGDWTLIDGKKMTLDVFQPFRRLRARFRTR